MMDFSEYEHTIKEKVHDIMDKGGELDTSNKEYADVCDLQSKQVMEIRDEYLKKCKDDEAVYTVIGDVFDYIIDYSTSGNVCVMVDTEDVANRAKELLSELYDTVISELDVYPEGGGWTISVTFFGCYVPVWDGWEDE